MAPIDTSEWDLNSRIRVRKENRAFILKSAHALDVGNVTISSDGKGIVLAAVDHFGEIRNDAQARVAEGDGCEYCHVFGVEDIDKLAANDYDVSLYERGVGVFEWVNEAGPKLTYWVAAQCLEEEQEGQ